MLDWRSAPLAEVFFGVDEGEAYEIEGPGRALTGTLQVRGSLSWGPLVNEFGSMGRALQQVPEARLAGTANIDLLTIDGAPGGTGRTRASPISSTL